MKFAVARTVSIIRAYILSKFQRLTINSPSMPATETVSVFEQMTSSYMSIFGNKKNGILFIWVN